LTEFQGILFLAFLFNGITFYDAPIRLINGVPYPTRIGYRHSYDIYKTHYVQSERYFFIFDIILMIKKRTNLILSLFFAY